jgi:hypothetical protein
MIREIGQSMRLSRGRLCRHGITDELDISLLGKDPLKREKRKRPGLTTSPRLETCMT